MNDFQFFLCDMMVSFPAGIVQDFAIILIPMQLSFKIRNVSVFKYLMSFKLGTIDLNTEAFLILKENCARFGLLATT